MCEERQGNPKHVPLCTLAHTHAHTHAQTLANLRFCAAVEPDNEAVKARMRECQGLQEKGLPTLPSTLGVEAEINCFLRTHLPSVRKFTHPSLSAEQREALSSTEVLGALREAKNSFK